LEAYVSDIYTIRVQTIEGPHTDLSAYKGKVLLIVNVASKCGFTDQYEALETLYTKFANRGFVILGFPCNQFGNQEPGNDEQIMEFCRLNYGVTFPLFAKIKVNGDSTHLLYEFLRKKRPGVLGSDSIKWNFTKFLIDRSGHVVQRFPPSKKPVELENDIEMLL